MTGNTLEQRAAEFCDAMEARHGYRPRVRDGELVNGRDADRFAGWMLATEALRLPAGDGWQPIETAPKDRTDILIAGGTYSVRDYPDLKFSGVGIAFWDRNHWHGNEDNAHDEWCRHQPTHWQPLPAAPRHETGEVDRG